MIVADGGRASPQEVVVFPDEALDGQYEPVDIRRQVTELVQPDSIGAQLHEEPHLSGHARKLKCMRPQQGLSTPKDNLREPIGSQIVK